jgi:FkbM family methyltransferase
MKIYEFGKLVYFVREDTTDWNTINACMVEDEYDLGGVDVAGKLVFDIGAHVGGLSVWLAARGATVVAVEPLPENYEQVAANANLNAVNLRVVHGAVGSGTIYYGADGDAHRYIGNSGIVPQGRHLDVPTYTLDGLREAYGYPSIIKLDCEGGEWAAICEDTAKQCPLIVGEWHPVGGHTRDDVVHALGFTHQVTFSGPTAGPGGFRAEHG